MITTLLILLPLVAALLIPFLKKRTAAVFAVTVTVINLAIAIFAFINFVPSDGLQFATDMAWVSNLGLRFSVGLTGISLLLVLLVAFLSPLILLSTFNRNFKNPNTLYALILLMQGGLTGAFAATNGLLFYVFWELSLVPVYLICAIWRGEQPAQRFFKFFIYTIFGSFLMLIAFIYLYLQTPDGSQSFQMDALYALNLTPGEQFWIFWAFFVAFGVKIPIFPLHTWQPDTYTNSPTPATILLSALMLKMALFGMVVWLLPIVPYAAVEWGMYAIVLCVIGIVYASVIAIRINNIKRIAAFSSMAHVGLIAAGIFTLSNVGLTGALFQMLSHGLTALGIFYIADIIYNRTGTLQIKELGGIAAKAPKMAVAFLVILLAMVALPLTSGFWGEFLLLVSVYNYNTILGIFSSLTVILSAVYMLRMYRKTMHNQPKKITKEFKDLNLTEILVLTPVIGGIILLGIYPELILHIARPAVAQIIEQINANI